MRQTFKQGEGEQILQEAVRREVQQPALSDAAPAVSQERLRAMATELGISPAALEAVLRDREMQTRQEQERATLAELRREFITHRRAGFLPHLSAFVGVNTGSPANLVVWLWSDILKHGYTASAIAASRSQIVKPASDSRAGSGHGAKWDDCS